MTVIDGWTALSDPTRREILARVVRESSSVTELARDLPVSRPAVSQHLLVLLDAQLVSVHKQGRQRIYTARLDGLEGLRHELNEFWNQALANLKRVAEDSYEPKEKS